MQERIRNRHYSYTKSYPSLKEGLSELFKLNPEVVKNIGFTHSHSTAHLCGTIPITQDSTIFDDDMDDKDIARHMFNLAVAVINNSFPTIYDEVFPATAALSITGDRFYIRFTDRTALMWDYDNDRIRNGEDILVHITMQFTEPTNKLLSNKLTQDIKVLEDNGYTYIDDKTLRERRSPRLRNQNSNNNNQTQL